MFSELMFHSLREILCHAVVAYNDSFFIIIVWNNATNLSALPASNSEGVLQPISHLLSLQHATVCNLVMY